MEDDQQFCLRWNNHQATLVAVFDTLLENGTLIDCTLAAEGKYLNAHKVVLSACSPYFETLLSQNYDKHPVFILKDVKFQELKAMMDYMYRGEVNISQDQLGALLKAAESLQIKGLSDNKKDNEPRKPAPPPVSKSPPPSTSLPRVQGLTIEQRRANRNLEDREGSQSPGPRKRKRQRRRSTDDLDNHDASNSSESHSNPPIQNTPIALPPPVSAKMLSEVPEPIESKADILRHKESELAQVPIIKEKIETTHTELMLEPKAEYVEEMNEDSIEDLTLDDDDVSNLDMSNDGAGPSHGSMGDGSGQGFGWHMGNQNQDEVFLAAQEAVGAHRDNQGIADLIALSDQALIFAPQETLSALTTSTPNIEKIRKSIKNLDFSSLSESITFKTLNISDADFKRQIIRQIFLIQLKMNKFHGDITNVMTKFDRVHPEPEKDSILKKFKLPLNTSEELFSFEGFLADSDNGLKLMKELSLIGGTTHKSMVKRVMSKIFANELAMKYSWVGFKHKANFSVLSIARILIVAVQMVHPNTTEADIENEIKQFLVKAKERLHKTKV